MSTFALLLIASVVGWLATLSLVRDIYKLEFTDFLISSGAAFCAAYMLPWMGIAVWGDYGLRLAPTLCMALAAFGVLMLANLVRGRGFRAGALRLPAVRRSMGLLQPNLE